MLHRDNPSDTGVSLGIWWWLVTATTSDLRSPHGPRSSLDRVRDALVGRGLQVRSPRPTHLMANCPVHEDRTPSLSVRWTQGDRGGMVLLNCHGCGSHAVDIVASLGLTMADLFDEPLPPRQPFQSRVGRTPQQRRSGQRRGKLGRLPQPIAAPSRSPTPDVDHAWVEVETYPYVDACGALVQEVVREGCTSCDVSHKQFRQVFVVNGIRRKRKPVGFTPVLYRLPQILAAVDAGRPVWLLEGEKDVATAEGLGLVATTNTQGGRAFSAELAQLFRGADVRVVLDRDEAGWDRGVGVHRALDGIAGQVRLFLPATTDAKTDLTDHVVAGHDVADLVLVHVEEVAAWAATAAAGKKHALVEQAYAEVRAQLAAAEDACEADSVSERRRFARRWAIEAEIRHEALQAIVDEVRGHVARTGTDWAVAAFEIAGEMLRQATTAARAAHEAVGLALPPALQLPALCPPDTDAAPRTDGGGAGAGYGGTGPAPAGGEEPGDHDRRFARQPYGEVRDGVSIDQPKFRIVNGSIVQIDRQHRRSRDADWGDDGQETLKLILGLDVRILEMEYLEEDDTVDLDTPRLKGRESRNEQATVNPPAPAELSAVVVAFTHPLTGETMQMRVTADQWRDASWLESLPGQPDYDARPTGLANLRRAIRAVSDDIRTTTRYRWTGWRCTDAGEWMYVHAGGAITAGGVRAVPVLLTGPLARYDLPDPSSDGERLRAAFVDHSAAMLTRLPLRVAAPLLGHVYRSALGPNPWVVALIGSKGSYKTSIASLAMHHWGELWDRRKPATSMSGNGDTLNALRLKLNNAKDSLYWADDVAPTRGWDAAQKHLEEFARMVHNAEQRNRSTRDGLAVVDGTAPRASALVTSEVMPRPGSAADRILVLPLRTDEIDLDQLTYLDQGESRHGRALLMASLLRWMATDLTQIRQRCLDTVEQYAKPLRTDGVDKRLAEAAGNTWSGWVLMTEFLVAMGAITGAERDQVLARTDRGIREGVAATTDPDLPTSVGARVRELICHALRSGLAYADDVRTGDAPPWPLAGRLGWRRAVVGVDDVGGARYRMEARGVRFGYVLHNPHPGKEGVAQLLVESTALEQVLKATSLTMADSLQIDRGTAIRALYDEGVLIAEERTGMTPRYTVQRTLHCEEGRRQRVTSLRLGELLGDDPGNGSLPVDPHTLGSGPTVPTRGPTGPEPGSAEALFGPHDFDSSQHGGLASTSPTQGLTSPNNQEHEVRPEHADAEGLLSRGEMIDPVQPCVMCGVRCGVSYFDQVMHVLCWRRSTRESRAAAARQPVTPREVPRAPHEGAATQAPQTPAPANATAARRRNTAVVNSFVAPAAVLHTDGVWLPDGSRSELPQPLEHVGHVAQLVDQLQLGTQVTTRRTEPGQVWVTAEALTALGVDADQLPDDPTKRVDAMRDLTRGASLVDIALEQGWRIGGAGNCLGAWTRVWRGEQRGVWVALIPAMNHDPLETPILGDRPSPAVLARRLALFAGQLRAPWAMSAATTGLDLMITLRARDRERLFTPRDPVPPAQVSTLEQDLNWSRVPTETEQSQRYVHAYDRGGSYAAGIAGLELGIGDADHHEQGRAFDHKLPGYWKFEVPDGGDWRFPHPLKPRGSMPARPVWATTPGVQLAYELGYEVPILEAYTWPDHGRILDPWYERIRDARSALDVDDVDSQKARDLLKVVYTRTIGMLGSEEWMRTRPGYAPDRRHHIVAKARSNILRRILQIGRDSDRWPVAVTADTLVYVSDDPDPAAAWPGNPDQLGRGFGQFKPEASGLLVDQMRYLNGKDYRGKDRLDDGATGGVGPAEVAS